MRILNVERGTVANTLYIQVSDQPVAHSFEWTEDIILDLDENNALVGIDIQNITDVLQKVGDLPDGADLPGLPTRAKSLPQQETEDVRLQLVGV